MPLEKKIHSSQSLNQKLHYVIKMFAKNYFCILMADFQENDIAVSHISEPVLPLFSQKLSGAGDFRELIAFYCSQYVLEQEGVTAGDAVFFDDVKENIEAAREAGIESVWVEDNQTVPKYFS